MQWRDRFTDKQIKLTDPALLTPNPRNPRKHPERQRKAVKGSLDTLGWVAPVIVNSQTGLLLDGHERVQQALASGSQVPVIEVDLTPEEELQFLATFDYITYLAEFDKDIMSDILNGFNSDNAEIQLLASDIFDSVNIQETALEFPTDDNLYSRKVEPPIYTPSNKQPLIVDLFDDTYAQQLITEIQSSSLSTQLKDFLILAAYRHVVFNYTKIADFYAHSSADIQELMENSALVIIDYDKAIERGFVVLTDSLSAIQADDHADDND